MDINHHIKVTSHKNNKGSSDTFYLGFIFVLIVGGGYYIYDDMQKNAPVMVNASHSADKNQPQTIEKSAPIAITTPEPAAIVKADPPQLAPAVAPAKPDEQKPTIQTSMTENLQQEDSGKSETTPIPENKVVVKQAEPVQAEKSQASDTEINQPVSNNTIAKKEPIVETPYNSKAAASSDEKVQTDSTSSTVSTTTKEQQKPLLEAKNTPATTEDVAVNESETAKLETTKATAENLLVESQANTQQKTPEMARNYTHPMYEQPGFIPPPQAYMPPRVRRFMPEPDYKDAYNPEQYIPRMPENYRPRGHENYFRDARENYMPRRPYYPRNRYYQQRATRPQNPYYGY